MNAKMIKLSLVMWLLCVGLQTFSQTQTLCGQQLETYTVDDGDSSGSGNYTWTLQDSGANDFTPEVNNQGQNQITIDWSNTAVFTVGETYTLSVIETVNGCPGPEQILTIELVAGYEPPTITALAPVCDGNTTNFELVGGSLSAFVTYEITSNVNGSVVGPTTVQLDAVDTNTNPTLIPVPALADPTVAETFTLTLTDMDDDGSDSCNALDIDPDLTESVTVNPAPTTSAIDFN